MSHLGYTGYIGHTASGGFLGKVIGFEQHYQALEDFESRSLVIEGGSSGRIVETFWESGVMVRCLSFLTREWRR